MLNRVFKVLTCRLCIQLRFPHEERIELSIEQVLVPRTGWVGGKPRCFDKNGDIWTKKASPLKFFGSMSSQ